MLGADFVGDDSAALVLGDLTDLVTWVAIVMAVETVLVAPTVLKVVFARTPLEGDTVSTTSMTLRERAWLPLEYIRTVGPLTGVTAERLRTALIGLHAADPAHRAVSRLDRGNARWLHLDGPGFAAYVREAVTDLGPGPADFDAMSRELQALCFLAGANSIFTGDRLLTAGNAGDDKDAALHQEGWLVAKHGHKRASECVDCGACERACPQHIAIRSELARCVEALGIEG